MVRDVRVGRGGLTRSCPCGTGLPYRACCAPCHFGDREASDAASLMRSRYSAFAVGDTAYLWRTLHTGHADRGRNKDVVLGELKATVRRHKYMGLKILESRESGSSAAVLFRANVFKTGADCSFIELSDFLREGACWRYLYGTGMPCARLKTPVEELTIASFSAIAR